MNIIITRDQRVYQPTASNKTCFEPLLRFQWESNSHSLILLLVQSSSWNLAYDLTQYLLIKYCILLFDLPHRLLPIGIYFVLILLVEYRNGEEKDSSWKQERKGWLSRYASMIPIRLNAVRCKWIVTSVEQCQEVVAAANNGQNPQASNYLKHVQASISIYEEHKKTALHRGR